jgi:hypothetical protein
LATPAAIPQREWLWENLRQIGISLPSIGLRLAKKSQLGKMVLGAIRFGGYQL